MTLQEYLQSLYPDNDFAFGPIRVQDNGYGQFIGRWEISDPRPTAAELLAEGIVEGKTPMATSAELAAADWEEGIRSIVEVQARGIVKSVGLLSEDAYATGIEAIIAETPAGTIVPGTTILKEDAQLWEGLSVDIEAFLGEEVTGRPGMTRRQAILRRVPKITS